VTRKRRKTRSRQERRRIHARTRQTFVQLFTRTLELKYEAAMSPKPHPFMALWLERNTVPAQLSEGAAHSDDGPSRPHS
jgi:hypothetical protein